MSSLKYPQSALSDLLFDELSKVPFVDLSVSLKHNVKLYPKDVRRAIVSQYRDEVTPLFVAVMNGYADEVVRFLVRDCDADVEQKCHLKIQEAENATTSHVVTALWCAAVKGYLSLCTLLIEQGRAEVNSVSDSGSTPIRSACFMNKIEIVRYLVSRGADVNKPNVNGGTCLINSVQSLELCRFLLANGASIDGQDMHGKTALHYAIQENRADTMRALVEGGANVSLKNSFGDDALQTAAMNSGAFIIFEYLSKLPAYPMEYVLNQYDLLGACVLERNHDISCSIKFWDHSLKQRIVHGIGKKPKVVHCLLNFRGVEEFVSSQELENLRLDGERMHLQSLLIYERVLGSNHRETIFRMLYRGAVYADLLEFQKCLYIWVYVYETKLANDVIYHPDTVFTGKTICIVLMEMSEKFSRALTADRPRMCDLIRILSLTQQATPEALEKLAIHPVSIIQEHYFKKTLLNVLYLLAASAYAWCEPSLNEEYLLKRTVYELVRLTPLTSYQATLLHLSIDTASFLYFHPLTIFPSLKIVRLLIETGSDVNARDTARNSPLHFASVLQQNFVMMQIVKLLLKNGSHYDSVNRAGRVAGIAIPREPTTYLLRNINLKCLSSLAIRRHKLEVDRQSIPVHLAQYLALHL